MTGSAVEGIGHDHAAQPGLQVGDVTGQAQNGHDLAGHGDVEAVLPGDALHLAAQAVDDVAQLAVVHVHAALPDDLLDVDAQGVALLDVVVQQGGQQVVGRADGVEIAGEVKVDVLHGDDLGIAAAGGSALDAEHRPQGRLPQGGYGVFADFAQAVRQAHGGGGLAFAGGGGGDGGDEDELAVGPVGLLPQQAVVDLGLAAAILLHILGVDAAGGGNVADGQGHGLLGDLDICHVLSPFCSLSCPRMGTLWEALYGIGAQLSPGKWPEGRKKEADGAEPRPLLYRYACRRISWISARPAAKWMPCCRSGEDRPFSIMCSSRAFRWS